MRAVLKFVILARVDSEGSNTMLNCLMYKMCYYRFGQVYTEGGETHTHTIDCVCLLFTITLLCPRPASWL